MSTVGISPKNAADLIFKLAAKDRGGPPRRPSAGGPAARPPVARHGGGRLPRPDRDLLLEALPVHRPDRRRALQLQSLDQVLQDSLRLTLWTQ